MTTSTTPSAAELKASGNAAFSSKDYDTAIAFFSQAIDSPAPLPDSHVLYSNRSASWASLKNWKEAEKDARSCISASPSWPKGYSRLGAALFGEGNHEEAIKAYKEGLALDPENAILKKGLAEVEADLESANGMDLGLGSLFGPDIWAKMASNPKLSPLLADPSVVAKIQQIQQNPKNVNAVMQDPKMMTLIMGLMGLNADVATDPSTHEAQKDAAMDSTSPAAAPQSTPEPTPKPEEPAPETPRSISDGLKASGNAAYKSRHFEEALEWYEKAWNADETNIAVLTNKSAVLFEMGKYDECVAVCETAVETGRSLHADFKLIARAFSRLGAVYQKQDKVNEAIKYYEKSLSEHRTPDVLSKLKEMEKLKKELEKKAYHNPALSDEAREAGNALLKSQNYAEAVKSYTEAIKRNESDPRPYTNRAICYKKLMALPEAIRDCDKAISLDPSFIKAYIRKASILFMKRDFNECLEACALAKEMDTEKKHTAEIDSQMGSCYSALNGFNQQNTSGNAEENLKRAQNDPKVQEILGDPAMQMILQQMQQNPMAAQEHMKNPAIAAKIRTLIAAGIIQTR